MLRLYQAALRLRRSRAAFRDGELSWQEAPAGVLSFSRVTSDGGVRCVANLSDAAIGLPADATVLLASGPLADGLLPPDTAAWLAVSS
jgi:alpha-glucosidase